MENIADRIKLALEIRQMKQSDLVASTGIGKSSISTYISGEYEPKQKNIYKIAKALNVSVGWLMGLDVPMERVSITSEMVGSELKKVFEECGAILAVPEDILLDLFFNTPKSEGFTNLELLINKSNLLQFFQVMMESEDKQLERLITNYKHLNDAGREQILNQSEIMLKSGMYLPTEEYEGDCK